MTPATHRLARSLAALASLAAMPACSPHTRGTPPDLPARPPIGAPIDRAGRPLTGNALIGPIAADDVSDRRKEQYNRAGQAEWPQFADDIQQTLGLYDGFDHACGNQWLADAHAAPPQRYRRLAQLLADDRLWVDSRAAACTRFLAVEASALAPSPDGAGDCGGRTPAYDVVDVYRSLLVLGATSGVDDGIAHDDREHSTTAFPFLAAP